MLILEILQINLNKFLKKYKDISFFFCFRKKYWLFFCGGKNKNNIALVEKNIFGGKGPDFLGFDNCYDILVQNILFNINNNKDNNYKEDYKNNKNNDKFKHNIG